MSCQTSENHRDGVKKFICNAVCSFVPDDPEEDTVVTKEMVQAVANQLENKKVIIEYNKGMTVKDLIEQLMHVI